MPPLILVGYSGYFRALWRQGSVSNVDAGLERGRGRGAPDSKGPGTARGLLTYPKLAIVQIGAMPVKNVQNWCRRVPKHAQFTRHQINKSPM